MPLYRILFFLGISPYQVIQELLGQIGKRSGAFARAFGQRSTSTQNVHKYSTVVFPSPKKFAEIATRAYIIVLAYDQWSKYTVVPVNISTDCLVADQADLQYRCPTTAIKRVYCEDAIFGHKEQDERYGPYCKGNEESQKTSHQTRLTCSKSLRRQRRILRRIVAVRRLS